LFLNGGQHLVTIQGVFVSRYLSPVMQHKRHSEKRSAMSQPIVATLGYLLDESSDRVLLIHRHGRCGDPHLGKYNGLGGKLESNESVLECLAREFNEEAGIQILDPELRGVIHWPGFGQAGDAWLGFIFIIRAWVGEPMTVNTEGTLAWHPVRALLSGELPIWAGDRHFLPLVFDRDPHPFDGLMPYENGQPTGWRFQRM
jgi:8-oxo-dGTP diphosphatase